VAECLQDVLVTDSVTSRRCQDEGVKLRHATLTSRHPSDKLSCVTRVVCEPGRRRAEAWQAAPPSPPRSGAQSRLKTMTSWTFREGRAPAETRRAPARRRRDVTDLNGCESSP
jgi:hypothetical protein